MEGEEGIFESRNDQAPPTLADVYGYFEESESNIWGILQQCGLDDRSNSHEYNAMMPSILVNDVQQELKDLPARSILDFLIQYFFKDYERWWKTDTITRVADVEFAVLMLRICAYSSHFLLSQKYTVDTIKGRPLSDIRSNCGRLAERLEGICNAAMLRGSLMRVQYMYFTAMCYECETRIKLSWVTLCCAIREAQEVGLHREPPKWGNDGMDDLEREMRRRMFCNLYIWDSRLARALDRVPFLVDAYCSVSLPQMHLHPTIDNLQAPGLFTERVLQARLVRFWKNLEAGNGSPGTRPYDPVIAEERYQRFCNEFLPELPAPFALEPNTDWDQHIPELPRQRKLFHVALFESVMHNFRLLLRLDRHHLLNLPNSRMALVTRHRHALATAAMGLFQSVTSLHANMSFNQTKLSLVVFYYFETAVVLSLCILRACDSNGMQDLEHANFFSPHSPLSPNMIDISQNQCMRAIEEARSQLEMMSLSNVMAETGARQLGKLVDHVRATLAARSGTQTRSMSSTETLAYNSGSSTSHGDGRAHGVPSEPLFAFWQQEVPTVNAFEAESNAFEGLMPWNLSTDALPLDPSLLSLEQLHEISELQQNMGL
ncbi:trascription factor [Byssothecium circinans]|uniref:Trascription factor n=1 Tax=Byssothecium circinans TaxID=147558 RepID=A0A6A5TVA4_9PLEO|nr:trascription factor [Byssothecium circinans]